MGAPAAAQSTTPRQQRARTGMAAAARHLLNPLASAEQIARTPSREDGVDAELETDLRAYGALLIQQVGVQLKAPQVLMTTASVLFQRFWYVSSMRSFSVKTT